MNKKIIWNNWVKDSYNTIAKVFSQTRNYDWPEFTEFWKFLSLEKNKSYKILDIWCWNWRLINFLNNKFWNNFEYIWLDISEWLLNEARKQYPNSQFICWDMIDLNFLENESIDFVFSIASFHHLNSINDRIKHLQELHRVLKKWWRVFMTNWNLFQMKYLKCFFINFLQKKSWNDTFVPFKIWNKFWSNRYYHSFLPFELKNLFKKSWFILDKEFFMKKWKLINWLIWSFNICNILSKK